MKKHELESLPLGSLIRSWTGGPIYKITKIDDGRVTASQEIKIEIVGRGKSFEHYPWELVCVAEEKESDR